MKALKNCIKLGSKVTVYVPATTDVDKTADTRAYVEKTASLLAECFGGATSSPAIGYWLSSVSGLVREDTTIVFAYASEADLTQKIDTVVGWCEAMREELTQESIALEINGEMYFI
jgi:hypothetical protein